MLEFANGVSGMLGTVRATPFYWRAHVFGRKGSAEALGENDLVMRLSGATPRTQSFEPVDALRAEFDAFADAVAGRAPYPIPMAQMVDTVAAFEAVIKSIESDRAVLLDGA
jgi:predicted dehydrogenase